MKKLVFGVLALAALLPAIGHTQEPVRVDRLTLANAFDLDGEAADDDQIVTSADLLDSTTFTVAAQPDSCRLVDITVTDANSSISAGTMTIVGTGCLGEAKTCSFTFASGGSGVKTLTCTDGYSAYLASVTSVTTDALTGEGGAGVDTVKVGYTSNSVNGWPMYGRLVGPDAAGQLRVDPFGRFPVPLLITTSGSLSTTVTDVNGSDDAFSRVAAGDLLIVKVGGIEYERKITAKASADSITINQGLNIPSAGVTYAFKKAYFSTNPADQMVVPVGGYKTATFWWSVDANANTGGLVTLLQCTTNSPEYPTAHWTTLTQTTSTVASGATQGDTYESINLSLLPYQWCRLGFRFGTGDDADAAAEDINLSVVLVK